MTEPTAQFVIPAAKTNSLPIVGNSARFPVNRIFCVGRNYADHAREMGHDPNREPPFFFMKPANTIVADGKGFPYPSLSKDVQFEVELVVALHIGGTNISVADANKHVYAYSVGLDMTRRDLQSDAKKQGRPWEPGKAFDHSAPCAALVPASSLGHPSKGTIELKVNGQTKQKGDLSELIWSVPETIAYLSTLFALEPGDLIFTGTPAGVGPIVKGDKLSASVEDVASLEIQVI